VRLRVLTINVQNSEGDPRRVDLITRELRRIDPDLVSLQEVVHSPERNQLAQLLEGTNLLGTHQAQVMAYTPPWADRYGGSAIATRWPHHVVEVLDPRVSGAADVPWCALATVVTLPEEGNVLFIGATSSWRLGTEAVRERQAVALTDLDARHRQALPTIIAGDFNATPDAASIRFLTGLQSLDGRSVRYHDAWEVAGDGPGHTWTSDNDNARGEIDHIVRQPKHRRRLDYVFVGSWDVHPTAHAHILSASLAFNQSTDGVWPSDHFGVVVDLNVGKDL
jgi:endonuclease/exonuclease/phosphatase family metal-dependent hydrolase